MTFPTAIADASPAVSQPPSDRPSIDLAQRECRRCGEDLVGSQERLDGTCGACRSNAEAARGIEDVLDAIDDGSAVRA
jgi:hypothetical protein